MAGSGPGTKGRAWVWAALVAAWLGFRIVYPMLGPQIMAAGGYVLTNVVAGSFVGVVLLLVLREIRIRYRRTEEGAEDDVRLKDWKYRPPSRAGIVSVWVGGAFFLFGGVALWHWGRPDIMIVSPVIGTFLMLGSYMHFGHERALAARTGQRPVRRAQYG